MLGKILKFLFSLLCIVAVGFAIYCAATPGALDKLPKIASAAEEQTVYTSALEDLSKDANFSTNNYPTIADRYTVQVVQLAESAASELFIYTYEPSTNAAAHASSINISTAMNEDLNYKNYELKFLNNSGTLNKYLVKDFELKQDALRYYDISNIYRAWSSELGDTPGQNGNVVTEVPFAVGQLWTATTTDGKVNYSCTSTETIEITDKYVGYVRYPEGYRLSFGINEGGCDSHFVAFSTDKKIENLVEAEVFYKKQDIYIYGNKMVDGSIKPLSPSRMGEIETQYTTLDNTEEKTYEGNGWFHSKFTFKLIQSAEQFVAAETRSNIYEGGLFNVYSETKLTEDGLKNIQNKQWVLRFYESRYS